MAILTMVVYAAGAYLLMGCLFALVFIFRGVGKIDPAAGGASLGFKLLIIPGVTALWPLMAKRWIGGRSRPPLERNAHRDAAGSPEEAHP